MKTYNIKRMYERSAGHIIRHGLTLEEAQAHCKDEDTHGTRTNPKDGKPERWFDGYDEE